MPNFLSLSKHTTACNCSSPKPAGIAFLTFQFTIIEIPSVCTVAQLKLVLMQHEATAAILMMVAILNVRLNNKAIRSLVGIQESSPFVRGLERFLYVHIQLNYVDVRTNYKVGSLQFNKYDSMGRKGTIQRLQDQPICVGMLLPHGLDVFIVVLQIVKIVIWVGFNNIG